MTHESHSGGVIVWVLLADAIAVIGGAVLVWRWLS